MTTSNRGMTSEARRQAAGGALPSWPPPRFLRDVFRDHFPKGLTRPAWNILWRRDVGPSSLPQEVGHHVNLDSNIKTSKQFIPILRPDNDLD